MDVTAIVAIVVKQLKEEPGIEGAFLHHPILDKDCQDATNIDIGIVSKDTLKDFRKAYGLYEDILCNLGSPIQIMEREREHCKEARALYGRSAFPPLGLCVRLVFCQLKYVAEQDVSAGYQLLFDRTGEVKEQLTQALPEQPAERTARELQQQLSAYPFHLHNVARALARKDRAGAQSATELMRQAVYFAAAVRSGQHTHCAERGWHTLAPGEKWVLENSFQAITLKSIERLTNLYIACLSALPAEYHLDEGVAQLKHALPELI